jgi:hypothetical protein
MAGQHCDNCVYLVCDPELWNRLMWRGESIVPRCANHPFWPGQLHDVPGVACRNYRPKSILPEGDNVRMIPLGDGFYAYVDAADYDWLSKDKWHLLNGYASRKEKRRTVYMHREITQAPADMVVDHFDANRTNNCRLNLRVCTPAENHANQRKQNGASSRFKGVFYSKQRHKWCAKCWFGGRQHMLGFFDDEAEAARAYDRKAVELFGEFARLNFPEEWPLQRRQEIYAQHPRPAESSTTRIRRGESSLARPSIAPQRARGKKAGSKEGKTTTPAKPRATRVKDGPRATREKAKGRKRKGSAKIINPKGTPGRRDRRRTTEKKAAGGRP